MKKKKILLIILPILLVVIVAGVLAILYFATDIFRSNKELFAKYFVQNGEIFDIIENANTDEQNEFKKTNTYTSNGELLIRIENGENAREVKTITSSKHDVNTGRTYSDMTLKNGEVDLLKASYINSGDVYAIKSDDILANYIGIRNSDLKTFARNMGMSEDEIESIPDSIDFESISNIIQLTEEQKQHIIDTYSKVVVETIPNNKFVKLGKKQISVNETIYQANAYQLILEESIMKQIAINCLNTLKDDNTTLVIISNIFTKLGLKNEYTDITVMSQAIEEQVTEMQNVEETTSTSNMAITITVYEHKKETIRTHILLSEENKKIAQVSIDKINLNNVQSTIINIENYENNNILGLSDFESEEDNSTTGENVERTQISLQKATTDTSIVTKMVFIPNTTNMNESITISTNIGKIQNNMFNNTSDVTISSSTDGANIETISASYTKNVQAVAQIEEIMELKNSNTVILNNYAKEQLMPFLENLGNKISQVISNKMSQLGIGVNNGEKIKNIFEKSIDFIN